MVNKIVAAIVVALIFLGIIIYLVPYLGSAAAPARFILALIAIIIEIGIAADYDFKSIR